MNQTTPQKLRPELASNLCGISKATLLRWEKERPGFPKPSRPTPRVTLYDRDKLMAYLDATGVQGGSTA
jgi:predicted DNA-binding transcriptional regulator AlpA